MCREEWAIGLSAANDTPRWVASLAAELASVYQAAERVAADRFIIAWNRAEELVEKVCTLELSFKAYTREEDTLRRLRATTASWPVR